jgi:HEAT repeat protein
VIHRRLFVVAAFLVVGGCSSKKAKSGLDRLPAGPAGARKRMKGPQTMGNLLVASYIDDLKSPQAQKRLRAAEELGNMGDGAKAALPALQKLASDKDSKVSAAAKQAITSIKKK